MDSKSAFYMDNNDKDKKQTINICRRMHYVRNGKYCNVHKTACCEGGLQLATNGTKNFI